MSFQLVKDSSQVISYRKTNFPKIKRSFRDDTVLHADKKALSELEDTIALALKKIGAKKENDSNRFIPSEEGGYLHHFTLKKMKTKAPRELKTMVEKFILNVDRPKKVPPKKRAPKGSRKMNETSRFTRNQLEKMLHLARKVGDKEMVAFLSPKRPFAACKGDLIRSIKNGQVEPTLWDAYVEAVNSLKAV